MISQISGVIVDRSDQQLVLDVAGLGYEVEVPLALVPDCTADAQEAS